MNAPANDSHIDPIDTLQCFISFSESLITSFDVVTKEIDAMPPVKNDRAIANLIKDADALYRDTMQALRLHKASAETLLTVKTRATQCAANKEERDGDCKI